MLSFPEAQARFEQTYQPFIDEIATLEPLIQRLFRRTETTRTTNADLLVFVLTRAAVDDFHEAYILAANGLSIGALKIVRSLYERVVTAAYMADFPDSAQDFIDYDAVHKYKLLNRLPPELRDQQLGAQRAFEIEAEYRRVKPKFEKEFCDCGAKRVLPSWTSLDTYSLALKAKRGLAELYGTAFLWPTYYLHTSLIDAAGRIEARGGETALIGGAQSRYVGEALIAAHRLLLAAIELNISHFSLGMDGEIQAANDGFARCWDRIRHDNSPSGNELNAETT